MNNSNTVLLKKEKIFDFDLRDWCKFFFTKKSFMIKPQGILRYARCLFNKPLYELDLSRLNVDSPKYDPVYERNVRNKAAEILYVIDDIVLEITKKHFDVAFYTFNLEDLILSGEIYQKITLNGDVDIKPQITCILDALHESIQLLVLMKNASNQECIFSSLLKIDSLLRLYPWFSFKKSQVILDLIAEHI